MSLIATLEGLEDVGAYSVPSSQYVHVEGRGPSTIVVVGRDRVKAAEKELSERRGVICSATAEMDKALQAAGATERKAMAESDPARKSGLLENARKYAVNAVGHAQNRADAVRLARSAKAKVSSAKLANTAEKRGDRAEATKQNAIYKLATAIDKNIKTRRAGGMHVVAPSQVDGIDFSVSGTVDAVAGAAAGSIMSVAKSEISKMGAAAEAADPFGTSAQPKQAAQVKAAAARSGVDMSKVAVALRKLNEDQQKKNMAAMVDTAKKVLAAKTATKISPLAIGGGILALLAAGYFALR